MYFEDQFTLPGKTFHSHWNAEPSKIRKNNVCWYFILVEASSQKCLLFLFANIVSLSAGLSEQALCFSGW
jgi:hypothetical protein